MCIPLWLVWVFGIVIVATIGLVAFDIWLSHSIRKYMELTK